MNNGAKSKSGGTQEYKKCMKISTSTSFTIFLVLFFTNEVECGKEIYETVMNGNII